MLISSCQFWNGKSLPLQILHYSSLSWHITPLQILRSYLFYFGQKDPTNVPIFTLSSALVKMCQISQVFFQTASSLCKFWNKKFIPLQILYPSSVSWKITLSWKITPLYFFSSSNIHFAQKEPIKMKIFESFKCSGQNS